MSSTIDDRPLAVPPPRAEGTAASTGEIRHPWRAALYNAVPAWFCGTLLVLVLEWHATRANRGKSVLGLSPRVVHYPFHLLFMWDSSWYLALARHGYAGNAHEAIRFSPLLPLVTRTVSYSGLPLYASLLLVCWTAALGFAVLVHRVALLETGRAITARRATWLSQLAPGAFVLSMGYTEALTGLLAAAYLLAVRQYGAAGASRKSMWLWFAVGTVAGFGSGLVRPTGVLIASVGAVEILVRLWRRERIGAAGWLARLTMTATPALGVGSFLLWCHAVYGKFLLPYTEQTTMGLRGSVAGNPLRSAWALFSQPTSKGEVGGAGVLALALLVAAIALLWYCLRKMPLSFTVWAALSLLAAMTAPFFTSFPRYFSGDLPLLMTAATLARSRKAWFWTIGVSAALCAFYAYRALTGNYTP